LVTSLTTNIIAVDDVKSYEIVICVSDVVCTSLFRGAALAEDWRKTTLARANRNCRVPAARLEK
jgi:hypothetical protein